MIVRVWNLVTDSPPIDDTVPIILGGDISMDTVETLPY